MWCGGLTRNTANTNTPFSENNTTRKFVVGFVAFSLVVAVSKRQRFVMILLLARLEEKIREGFDYYSALISTVSAINALFFSSFSIILPPPLLLVNSSTCREESMPFLPNCLAILKLPSNEKDSLSWPPPPNQMQLPHYNQHANKAKTAKSKRGRGRERRGEREKRGE